ncbi:CGNR zinc finger domain-containing protein [Amycolatopsis sp. NPDC059657]|uniref:CGNR zinc finger domain-containing protein n=1 Tax=Amycolatopsis sp. NPDC059657 TaxID=3346899 RepID=UPI00367334DC
MNDDASLVVEFLNTVNVEENTDELATAATWHAWAAKHGLRPGPLAEAREARHALRAAVGDPRLSPRELRVPLHAELGQAGPRLAAEDVVAAVLAAATRLAVLGEWARLKICPADDCLWAFFDNSRNRSRTWCSMRVCGNREKARAWRARGDGRPQPVDSR